VHAAENRTRDSQTRAPFAACIPLLDTPDGIPRLQSGTPQLISLRSEHPTITVTMSDSGEEVQTGNVPLPKDVIAEVGGTKLFNKWCVSNGGGCTSLIQSRSYDEVEVRDISLTDYINIRSPVYIPHSAGRYAVKRFRKAQVWMRNVYWAKY
jgi:hypothetical protein